MLNGAGIYRQLRENLCAECSKTATLLNNVFSRKEINSDKKLPPQSPYQVFYINLPKYFFGYKGVWRDWNFKDLIFETTVENPKQR